MPKTSLLYSRRNCYDVWNDKKIKGMMSFSEHYKQFLTRGKTERLMIQEGCALLDQAGFVEMSKEGVKNRKPGQKLYEVNHHKSLVAIIIGKRPLREGMNMILTHIDSPRIDLKVNPLYEDSQIAMLKTQYYGGIKKYQWPTVPLELHGVVTLQNGKTITISIGEKVDDPVFVITDLLPHASGKQMERKASEIVQGEELNIMVGSIPVKDKKVKERVKRAIMELLHKKYGMIEEDFLSAEIEAVPAFEVRDLGFDRSFIGGYGHDDRSASYAALKALIDIQGVPERTTLLFWSDKEEVGSYGATGAQSNFLYHVIGNVLRLFDPAALDTTTRDLLSNSFALSGDVDAAFDPDYKEVHDERNTALLNHGVAITKYTGIRGKYGANDADAEYVGKVRSVFNANNIVWQTGLISKVDVGGGGTIALYLAALGIHIVDCGPGVLSMHSPFEVLSKADLYATYEAYKVFLEKMK